MNRSLLAFSVANVRLGLDAMHVQEVVPSARLVTPPELPPLLRGFLSINHTLVPVIRLEKLVLPAPYSSDLPLRLTDRLVITRICGQNLAWVVGNDLELLPYRTRDLSPVPEDHVLNDCADSILPEEPPVILLNPEKLLLEAERLRIEQLRARELDRLTLITAPTPALQSA
ncbi:chemotaxis protein CheW [Prosthecobacter debontii]|nr:chemotaxis protein CheW [Prosthecobacter debontii]